MYCLRSHHCCGAARSRLESRMRDVHIDGSPRTATASRDREAETARAAIANDKARVSSSDTEHWNGANAQHKSRARDADVELSGAANAINLITPFTQILRFADTCALVLSLCHAINYCSDDAAAAAAYIKAMAVELLTEPSRAEFDTTGAATDTNVCVSFLRLDPIIEGVPLLK